MSILDKLILKLYLWRFPEKPLEQSPEKPVIVDFEQPVIRTVRGACYVAKRPYENGWITKDDIASKVIAAMKPDLSRCLKFMIAEDGTYYNGENMIMIKGAIDVVISGNDFKFGD